MIRLSLHEQVSLYQGGMSASSIAKIMGDHTSSVTRRLKRLGIEMRSLTDAVNLSYAQDERQSIGRPREYTVNQSFFDVITPDSAYIVGVVQADGTMTKDRFSISAKASDAYYLSTLADAMQSNRPLQKVKHPHGEIVRLVVNSSRMASALSRWGIHSPRTWTASTHESMLLDRDYWRGMIDGDGTLCEDRKGRRILKIVGSKAICDQFLDFARHYGYGYRVKVHPCKSIFNVGLNGDEAVCVAKLLYSNASLFLPRKINIVSRWIEGRE